MAGPLLTSPRTARATPLELAAVLLLGVLTGLVAGYLLMGTAHAIMEIGAESSGHYVPGE
jgi:hypothetical protein